MSYLTFWRFVSALTTTTVSVQRAPTQQTFYFDKSFYSQKHVRALERVDDLIRKGTIYKHGDTTTVAQIDFFGQPVVIKRYNTHSIWHGIKQFIKVSRAYNSWFYAHWMVANNIFTPVPCAVIEQRMGWFRQRSYYLYEALDFSPLMDVLLREELDSPISLHFQQRIVDIFKACRRARVRHRDFKITNFLVHQHEIYLIDLDHMSYYCSNFFLRIMQRRDRKRFLRNFAQYPALHARFQTLLTFV